MVNERKPPQSQSGRLPISSAASQPFKPPLPGDGPAKQAGNGSQEPLLSRPPAAAEFGKASPLRNPLRQTNVFNTNQRRPEHHRSSPPSSAQFRLPQPSSLQSGSVNGPTVNSATLQESAPTAREGLSLPGQRRQPIVSSHPQAAIQPDFFEIAKPTNQSFKTIPAAPKPTFSSLGPHTTFQPFFPPPRKVVDLTGEDDGFDHNAALRDNTFGSADPYSYVDPSKASENIKALLEGAFDEDDERPKTRLKKRAKKNSAQKIDEKALSLAEKLASLDVKDEQKPSPNAPDEAEDEDDEDGSVDGLAVKLLPHQVEGVSWMIDKEIGERKKNGVLPKGGILADDMGLGKTIQSVTLILSNPRSAVDAKVDNPKKKMPGKDVGKGTLVVAPLALIKQWEAEIKSKVEPSHALKVLVHHGPSRTKSHLELSKYDVVITTYQVLASEHAGSSDHEDGLKVGCFGVSWYRVILDEAHSIKNRNAKSTQACCALRSWYRWCLTGTPMQNNLDELQSLIHFLRIKPYNELSKWKEHITGPMKNGKGHYAIKRVQYFLKAFMKRRTKDILKQEGALNFGGKAKAGEKKSESMQIVRRDVETITCQLDDGERAFYDRLAQRANDRLHDMMSGEKTDYIGALVLLLRLRQACNHPQLIGSAMKKDGDALATAGLGGNQSPRKGSAVGEVDELTAMLGGLGVSTKTCDVCQIELHPNEVASGSVRCADCEQDLIGSKALKKRHKQDRKKSGIAATKQLKMRNRKVLVDSDDEEEDEGEWIVEKSRQNVPAYGKAGGTDDEDAEGVGRSLGSVDSVTGSEDSEDDITTRRRRAHTQPTSTDVDSSTASDSESDQDTDDSESATVSSSVASTKIRKLLRILRAETVEHKTIVFSQFTSMLDLIEPHLAKHAIRYVRYDGSMRNDAREASLHSLRNDRKTRVLLCSLKCGSLGLNLTAASRVVIVEPFWNPFVEEQAIDRVHRLNQTVDVKVYKLTVADTVEERILELQAKKRELANAAIEGGKAMAKLSMKDLLGLFGANPEVHVGAEDERKWKAPDEGRGLLKPSQPRGTIAAPTMHTLADRSRQMQRDKPRVSNEDKVYGRR